MFDNLSERLNATIKKLTGQGRLSEKNIKNALRDVRGSLLEADVALSVIKDFIAKVRRRSLGKEVAKSLDPGQMMIKIIKEEMIEVMGEQCSELNLKATPPVVVMMAGLQGSGKTTTAAKLANILKNSKNKKVMLVSVDVYRPAAIKQLEVLAGEIEVDFFPSHVGDNPVKIIKKAIDSAKKKLIDVIILDTAGRLHIDVEMMDEVKKLHVVANPVETLFVVDSMSGQDAAITAKAFDDALPLTGVILTKADGDARGGAALSVRHVTGKPIKFIGVGEKIDALEAFHPDRIVSRILGMGDILSLIEDAQTKVDKAQVEKLAKKVKRGKGFDLQDFKEQLEQMDKMGGIGKLVDKLPGMGNISEGLKNQVGDKKMSGMHAIICSMTKQERRFPDIIKASRRKRIATGAGVEIQDVNKLLKQFSQMQKVMKKFGNKSKMMGLMRSIGGMGGMPSF